MNKWNNKNGLRVAFCVLAYVISSVIVCVLGSVHPVLFVCYQITAGILVTGAAAKAFDTIRSPGAAAFLSLGMLLTFFIIRDVNMWHCLPVIVIAVLAEMVRRAAKYDSVGDMIAAVIMSFSTFGYYGQIWFNRDFTYEFAVDEMPDGYAEKLMDLSPAWVLPIVIVIGIAAAVMNYIITVKIFGSAK